MSRQLAITKRVSLADLSEGWDDCYVLISPADYGEAVDFRKGVADRKKMSSDELLAYQFDILKQHFISGKIRVPGPNGEPQLVDMEADDFSSYIPLANLVFREVYGIPADPKGSSTKMAK